MLVELLIKRFVPCKDANPVFNRKGKRMPCAHSEDVVVNMYVGT